MLLAIDSRSTVLADLSPAGRNHAALTAYGFQSGYRSIDSSLGFNGQKREQQTGWYHLGNGRRVYNPVLMRFHSPDKLSPFGKGGLNPYAYCLGDPVNYTDPSGQLPEWLHNALFFSINVAMLAGAAAPYLSFTKLKPPKGFARLLSSVTFITSPLAIVGSALRLGGVEAADTLTSVGTIISFLSVSSMAVSNFRGRPKEFKMLAAVNLRRPSKGWGAGDTLVQPSANQIRQTI